MNMTLGDLVAQTAWARRLARTLVNDGAAADDVMQDALAIAVGQPPPAEWSLRGWLTQVMRNLARLRARGAERRGRREAAAALHAGAVPTPEELLEAAEAHRRLAALVNELAGPQRQVILMRYFEDLSAAEIARRLGIPAGTVRWRLKQALDQLRARLATLAAGEARQDWRQGLAVLAPLSGTAAAAPVPATGGWLWAGLQLSGRAKLAVGAVAVAVALVAARQGWRQLLGGSGPGASSHQVAPFPSGRDEGSSTETRRPRREHQRQGEGAAAWRSSAAAPPKLIAASATGDAGRGPPMPTSDDDTAGAAASALAGAPPPDTGLPPWFGQRGVERERIAGRVLFEGRPVAGAEVVLESALSLAAPALYRRERHTGADGHFDFGPWPAWGYHVSAASPGRAAAQVLARPGNPGARPPSDQLVLELTRCQVHVTGTVYDESGRGVPGARLRTGAGEFALAPGADTDRHGRYSLCLASGASQLRIDVEGYGTQLVTVPPGARPLRDVRLAQEAIVEGIVLDEDDRGEPGALLNFRPVGFPQPDGPALVNSLADRQGRFRVEGLTAGKYEAPVPFEVRAGEVKRNLVVRAPRTATVAGRVIREGRPVVGAILSAGPPGDGRSSAAQFSQRDGRFILHGVPLGESRFRVRGHRVLSPSTLTVGRGGRQEVTVEVAPE